MSEPEQARRVRRSREFMRNKLKVWEIPLPSEYDDLDPATLRSLVYHFARTGEIRKAARRTVIGIEEAWAALNRPAALDMIDHMVEEGSWPVGAPTRTMRQVSSSG